MEKFIEKPRHIEVQILGEWGHLWGHSTRQEWSRPDLSGLTTAGLQELSLWKTFPQEGLRPWPWRFPSWLPPTSGSKR